MTLHPHPHDVVTLAMVGRTREGLTQNQGGTWHRLSPRIIGPRSGRAGDREPQATVGGDGWTGRLGCAKPSEIEGLRALRATFEKPFRRRGHAAQTLVWGGRLLHVVSACGSSFPSRYTSRRAIASHGVVENRILRWRGCLVRLVRALVKRPAPRFSTHRSGHEKPTFIITERDTCIASRRQ